MKIRDLRAYIFLKSSNVEIYNKQVNFFAFITFLQLSVGYVFFLKKSDNHEVLLKASRAYIFHSKQYQSQQFLINIAFLLSEKPGFFTY